METIIDPDVPAEITARYPALFASVPMRPIRNEAEYQAAVEALDLLLDGGAADEAHPLADLAGSLGMLISAYETSAAPA